MCSRHCSRPGLHSSKEVAARPKIAQPREDAGKLSAWIPAAQFAQRLVLQPSVPTGPEAAGNYARATRTRASALRTPNISKFESLRLGREAMMELRCRMSDFGWALQDEVLSIEKGWATG